ncbi:MAG: hypothetical protein K2N24_04620 [Lachnospiraceae bacterium]|nr:hypothetical protein [Lachnospiraceae bacterium]
MRAFQTDLERAITSVGFMLAVVGIVVALMAGGFTGLWVDMEVVKKEGLEFGYHWQMLKRGLQSEAFTFALPILCTLGFGGVYLEEMKSGYYKFALPRYGRRNYVLTKVIISVLSGGLAMWLGVMLTALIYWTVYAPMEINMELAALSGRVSDVMYAATGAAKDVAGFYVDVTVQDALHSNMFLLLLQWSAIAFLMGGTWAGVSCFFAVLYGNRYMAYGASFLISYLLIILLTRFFNGIYIFNPREWFNQTCYWEGGNLGVMALLTECMLILMLVNGILMERKLAPA